MSEQLVPDASTPPSAGPTPAGADGPDASEVAFADPAYRLGVVDLLGVLALGEITAFERLAEDAKLAPTVRDKAALSSMACVEFGHYVALRDRLVQMGEDPYAAMAPFEETYEAFHRHTAPADWLEGMVKAFVGDGLAADFYREIAAFLDPGTRELIVEALADAGQSDFIVERVRDAIAEDPRAGGRLALWGRRLVGEALSQGQMVAAQRDGLTAVLVGGVDRPGMDLAGIGRMFARLTERHADRMARLGLAS